MEQKQNKTIIYVIIGLLLGAILCMCCALLAIGGWTLIQTRTTHITYDDGNGDPIPTESCHINECHGMDLTCGNGPQTFACTLEYRIGDGCRTFFNCVSNGASCGTGDNTRFNQCKSCVNSCLARNTDAIDQFDCEAQCLQESSIGK